MEPKLDQGEIETERQSSSVNSQFEADDGGFGGDDKSEIIALEPGEDPVGFGVSPFRVGRRGPRFEEDVELTRWGRKKMHRTPHAAKGM